MCNCGHITSYYSNIMLPLLTSTQAPRARLELFYKSNDEIPGIVKLLKENGINKINLTNKTENDNLLESVRILRHNLSNLDICCHYSLKYNYAKAPEPSFQRFQEFCQHLAASAPGASVLLVSGGGKKKQLDTVRALQLLHDRDPEQGMPVPLYVAFNPYLPKQEDFENEKRRLVSKLASGRVHGVYLQIGTDMERLQSGLEFLKTKIKQYSTAVGGRISINTQQATSAPSSITTANKSNGHAAAIHQNSTSNSQSHGAIQKSKGSLADPLAESISLEASSSSQPVIYGSIFLPSRRLLAQMKFRPWNGVYLGKEYLSSVEAADSITRQILQVYASHGVVPLVESAVKSEAELQYMNDLLVHWSQQ